MSYAWYIIISESGHHSLRLLACSMFGVKLLSQIIVASLQEATCEDEMYIM